jgi:F5/8 type C domain.
MANIALNGNVSADNTVAPFSASRAVDGVIEATHRWAGEVPCGLKLTLPAKKVVNRWVVSGMSKVTGWSLPGWPAPKYSISDYVLQGSNDGTNWVTIDSVASNQIATTDKTLATPANYQYYRVYVTKGLNCNNKIASIMDFQLYEVPPTSQYLSNLTINSGTLTPAFGKNTYSYTANVGYDTSSIVVTPTAEMPTYAGYNATIKVNNVAVASGAGTPINLNVGTNAINVDVTSAIGNVTQRYTITVTRADSNYLSSLVLMNGTTSIPLSPTFAKATTSYTASIDYDVSSITVTATKESANASITINGNAAISGQPFTVNNLAIGQNTITIAVTTSGMPVQNYIVTVKKMEDLYLSALKIGPNVKSSITLTPPFDKKTLSYTGSCSLLTTLTVTATADVPGNVNLSVNGNAATSGSAITIPVKQGQVNPITIVVTSKSTGDTNTYICNISVTA